MENSRVHMNFVGCNDPPRRYDINTLMCANFNFYKKNSLNLLMKIEVIFFVPTYIHPTTRH